MYCELTMKQIIVLLAIWCFAAHAARPLRSSAGVTRVLCNSNNPELIFFAQCQIECYRNETKLLILADVKELVTEVQLRFQCFRRQPNGYVPFVLDFNIDWCDFIAKRNNEIFNRMFKVIENFSNMGTKCPIIGYSYANVTLTKNRNFQLPFKLPAGGYRLDITINSNRTIKLLVNIFLLID